MADAGCQNVGDINTTYISKAILRISNKDSYTVIRSFLQHLYDNGALNNDLSRIIVTVKLSNNKALKKVFFSLYKNYS
jgi:hypothetical protein